MNTSSAIVLLVILGLLALAIRHIIRHGSCDQCDGSCCHSCKGSCHGLPKGLTTEKRDGE